MEQAARGTPADGFATLAAVVILGMVMALLGTVLANTALDNVSTSARTVQRGQALQAAEAGVDITYQKIATSANFTKMPCATAVTGTVGSTPSHSSYSVHLSYYTATGTTALACTKLVTARRVELTSTGSDLGQIAKVQSEADLSPAGASSVFSESLFVNSNLTINGANSFLGGKNTYVNGNMICNGSGTIYGSVTVIGTFTASGACAIEGRVEATGAITIGGSAVIGGTVISTGSTITVTGAPTVSGNMYAYGAINITTTTWRTNYLAAHTVTVTGTKETVYYSYDAYDTSLQPPTKQTFPTIKWTATDWKKKGYTTVTATTATACTKAYAAIYAAHTTSTLTYGSKPIAIDTSCTITIKPSSKYCPTWQASNCPLVPLARSLVIFTTSGFTLKTSGAKPYNIYTTGSGSTASRTLWIVVPTGTSCTKNGNITLKGTIGPTVNSLIYSPCTVKISGASAVSAGAIYASAFTPDGGMSFGAGTFSYTGASGGAKTTSPSVGILYERQLS